MAAMGRVGLLRSERVGLKMESSVKEKMVD